MCILFHTAICGLGLGLGLEHFGLGLGLGLDTAGLGLGLGLGTAGLGLGLGLGTAGLDYKSGFFFAWHGIKCTLGISFVGRNMKLCYDRYRFEISKALMGDAQCDCDGSDLVLCT